MSSSDGCQSGRMGRPAKALRGDSRAEGSNPSPSALLNYGCVYFISWRESAAPVKIGRTGGEDPHARLADLQVGNPNELVLLGRFDGTPDLEAFIHDQLKGSRIRGEWFRDSRKLQSLISLSITEPNHFTEGFGTYLLDQFRSTMLLGHEPSETGFESGSSLAPNIEGQSG